MSWLVSWLRLWVCVLLLCVVCWRLAPSSCVLASGDAAHRVVVCDVEAAIWAHCKASGVGEAHSRPSAIYAAMLPSCASQSAHSALCADAADGVAVRVNDIEAAI